MSSSSDRTSRRLAAEHAVTRALVEEETTAGALQRIVHEVTERLGWEIGVAWQVAPEGDALEPVAAWSGYAGDAFEQATRELRFRRGSGLPGRVWASGEPVWIVDVQDEAGFQRAAAAAQAGVHAGLAFPIPLDRRFAGVLEFYSASREEPDAELLDTMAAIGGQIGLFLSRCRAEARLREQLARPADSDHLEQQRRLEETAAELEATIAELQEQRTAAEAAREDALLAARWSRFLAEAGRVLATALDRDETLRMVAHLAVPAIADICVVDMLEDDGTIRRVEVAHAPGVDERLAREYRSHHPAGATQTGVPEVIRRGEPRLYRTLREADLRAFARDEGQLASLRGMRLHSLMIVPLIARARTLGAVTLATSTSGRHYDLDDLTTVEALANRAALAIDNAQLYEQALSANRAKGNFLAIMSHELRTPLTAIMGYTDILQAGIAGELGERQREYLERVMVSARHLLRLIDEILTYSRLEVGRERTRYQRVPLRQFTENAANLVRPAMVQKRLDFRIEAPPEELSAETDPEKLRQVLLDILFNAAKFTAAGRVTLRVRVDRGNVYFEVEDTGIGIRPDEIDRIFEPFWQAEEAMTRREGGTGMGLSVALRLTRLLGGDIDVRSTPEHGTTVTVRIPQQAAGAAVGPGSAAA